MYIRKNGYSKHPFLSSTINLKMIGMLVPFETQFFHVIFPSFTKQALHDVVLLWFCSWLSILTISLDSASFGILSRSFKKLTGWVRRHRKDSDGVWLRCIENGGSEQPDFWHTTMTRLTGWTLRAKYDRMRTTSKSVSNYVTQCTGCNACCTKR